MNSRKLRVESLEERTLLAVVAGGIEQTAEFAAPTEAVTWVVNTLDNPTEWDATDDVISLREAIDSASTGDTIIFDDSLAGGTITLSGTQLEISNGITIDATSIGGITIDAGGRSRVFYITGSNNSDLVELIGLRITGGCGESLGGGICSETSGMLTLRNCTVSGNTASVCGGGIYNSEGTVTLTNCTVEGNITDGQGGGIYRFDGTVTITNSTVSGNVAGEAGGGIFGFDGTLEMTNTIVSLNYAYYDSDISLCYLPFSGDNNIIGLDPSFATAPVFEKGKLANADKIDLSLTQESIAIDCGLNDAVESETDLAGNQRIVAAWRETPTVDIGAFEYQGQVEHENIPLTVVTTDLDIVDVTDDLISLREAIFYANEGDTVTFDNNLAGGTITLSGNQLGIYSGITIDATSIGGITIDADRKSRVFYVSGGHTLAPVKLVCLSIINGGPNYHGGGIYNTVTLEIKNCKVSENIAGFFTSLEVYGGGIYNSYNGSLEMINCCISCNSAPQGYGANIANAGIANLTNCTVSDEQGGCHFYLSGGIISFYNSIIVRDWNGTVYGQGDMFAYNTLSTFIPKHSQNCLTYDSSKPLFADPDHGDYTLAENSQAINKGNNDYVTTETDLTGNPRILNGIVDLGAYEYTGPIEPLNAPTILTGSGGYYVSYGTNRHQVTWSAVDRAVRYELSYSDDGGSTWTTLETNDTSAVVRGLTYGSEISYRVRALSTRYLENSDWSEVKSFLVCPMDINGDGDISGPDRAALSKSWLADESSETFRYYADINGDGDVSGPDRNILSVNWLCESDDPNLLYPRPVAADMVFAEFASANLGADLDVF